jgi:hypothetical protein
MALVVVYGLPADVSSSLVKRIEDVICSEIASITDLKIDEEDIDVYFPFDLNSRRTEKIIFIKVEAIPYRQGLVDWHRDRICSLVSAAIERLIPKFSVKCRVDQFDEFRIYPGR